MFLVAMIWINNDGIDYCVITETKEKAQEYIDKEMEGKQYNGTGYFDIIEIPKWN